MGERKSFKVDLKTFKFKEILIRFWKIQFFDGVTVKIQVSLLLTDYSIIVLTYFDFLRRAVKWLLICFYSYKHSMFPVSDEKLRWRQWKDFWRVHLIHQDIRPTPNKHSAPSRGFSSICRLVIFFLGVIHARRNKEYTEHAPWCVLVGGFTVKSTTIVESDLT